VATVLGTCSAVAILLQISDTLPVTTATRELSSSALKYIKNYLRSTMVEDRLNGLVPLYMNRDINLDCDKVIYEFDKRYCHLSFV
jgi:hypothetical protein